MKLNGRNIPWLIILTILTAIIILFISIYFKQDKITKESVIKSFIDNFDYFDKVKDYALNTDGDLYVDNNSGRLIINNERPKNSMSDSTYKNLNLNSLPIETELSKIIYNLKFTGIYEQNSSVLNGVIVFQRTIGGAEQGIVYLSDDSGKYGMRMVKIKKGWYYYFNGNT